LEMHALVIAQRVPPGLALEPFAPAFSTLGPVRFAKAGVKDETGMFDFHPKRERKVQQECQHPRAAAKRPLMLRRFNPPKGS
jgi:hypothetical protein